MKSPLIKEKLRKAAQLIAHELSDVGSKNRRLSANILKLPEYINAEMVFTYVSVGREPDTRALIEDALKRGKRVCVPKCEKDGRMTARLIAALSDLAGVGAFGIPEPCEKSAVIRPEDIDFAVVPGMAFDPWGNRLGRGGGYYDRYLEGFGGITCGLCFDALTFAEIPADTHDVPVNIVVTESAVMRMRFPASVD